MKISRWRQSTSAAAAKKAWRQRHGQRNAKPAIIINHQQTAAASGNALCAYKT